VLIRKNPLFMMTVVAALVGLLTITPAPASGQGEGQYKLGGAWTGKEEPVGHFWTSTLTPLDSAAKEATIHTSFVTSSAEMAGIAAKFGADAFSDFVGEARMMDRTTARWTSVGYALKRSQLNQPAEVKFILVLYGTWTFTDSSHAVLQYKVSIYPAATDADGDGMPDPGAVPLGVANVTDSARRVSILQ
jgi:hypothetical protein